MYTTYAVVKIKPVHIEYFNRSTKYVSNIFISNVENVCVILYQHFNRFTISIF